MNGTKTLAIVSTMILLAAGSSLFGETSEDYQSMIAARPGILRYYTFEKTTVENPTARSVAGQPEPLRHGGPTPLEIVPGRTPDRHAVRLDNSWFEGVPFDVSGAVTIEMWIAKHGQGSQLGNGRTNGMLMAQGDGYWGGLRIYTDYPGGSLLFQIGRPKPDNAVGVSVDEPAADGVWHHVAATWDGTMLRLYLDGLLLGAAPYDGTYTPPNGRLRIGFAGAGIGSVKLDVDEMAVWGEALSGEEILRHACPDSALPATAQTPFSAATEAVSLGNWSAAEADFARLAKVDGLPDDIAAVALWGQARSLWKQNHIRPAVDEYSRLFDRQGTPDALKAIAVRRCLYDERGVFQSPASTEIYRRLVDEPGLSAEERTAARLSLAERMMQSGDGAAARRQYEAVLNAGLLDGKQIWNVRLQIAHSHLAAGDFAGAKTAYRELADMPDCPIEFRGEALLAGGHAAFLQKDYAAAADAFAAVAAAPDLLPNHRQEAKERAAEMQRLAAGLPARDPAASRIAVAELPKPGAELFVAPNGNDTTPGTKQQPLATLAGARDAIRKIKSGGGLPPGGVCVWVAGGTYRVGETWQLGEEDSGTADTPIVYRTLPGQKPVFTGGVQITGFSPVRDPAVLARLPESARGKVYQTDLAAQGITDYGQIEQRGYGFASYPAHPWVDLYVDGRPMQLARWPNEGFVEVGKVHQGGFKTDEGNKPAVFEYPGDRPGQWSKSDDIWMFGYWARLWAGTAVKVAAIDPATHCVTTVQPSHYGYREGQPFYFFNVLEELDQPGQWYLDRKSGHLYIYPPEGSRGATVEMPILSAPFVEMQKVSHVTLRGLVFELGRREGLVMLDGIDNLVAGCTFGRLGTNGLIVQGGSGCGVLGCDIHTLGAGGIRMAGGDRASLTPGNHFVENCHIHDFTRIDRVYAPAVHLDGVGNHIVHNLFNDSPHHAMRVEGYDHTVELNEIHSVVYESDDQSGIDIYGNPAYRGLVIRYNFWHHIGSGHNVAGQAGIRLDDFISDVLMYGNVFYRSAGGRFGGIQIHGGKDNLASNNLFIDCKYAFSFSPWGQKRWEDRLADQRTQYAISRGGVDITKPPHSTRYPDLAQMKENADRNFIWRNVAVECGQFASRDRGVNEMMDDVVMGVDPRFADPAEFNFSLPTDSPVYRRLGFRPIPFDEIGLYQDEYRASWPVKTEITPHYVEE